jgi:hypothetical protein
MTLKIGWLHEAEQRLETWLHEADDWQAACRELYVCAKRVVTHVCVMKCVLVPRTQSVTGTRARKLPERSEATFR